MSQRSAIILAAGKSTRMKSHLPKPLHEVCGRPMLEYILRACYDAGCSKAIVVVGHGKEQVISQFAHDSRIVWVEQTEQLGTGHAVRMCAGELGKLSGDVFILAGDGPLIRGEVLKTLLDAHHQDHADASMATAILDEPTGYGRIIRDGDGNFVEIVEEVDATPAQRAIQEVFPSYYCVKIPQLLFALDQLKPNNRKGEYYLTDIYAHLRQAGKKVLAIQAVSPEDTLAVNTREQLTQVSAVMQDRIQQAIRAAGVTIVSPLNTYVEDGARAGIDTTIHPFTFIGKDARLGAGCIIGPFAIVGREGIVPDGATVAGNLSPENALLQTGA